MQICGELQAGKEQADTSGFRSTPDDVKSVYSQAENHDFVIVFLNMFL